MKRYFYYLILILIPFIIIGLLEACLILFNIGPANEKIFIEEELNSSYLSLNPEIARRYFQSDLITVKGERDLFLKIKDKNTIRVVVQGASSVQGFPYGNSISAPRLLKANLKELFPDQNIEVINLGITAVSSYVLRDMAKEISKISPDVVIIYSGHNEFYGVYGSSSSQFATAKRSITNAFLYLKRFRLFRLLNGLMREKDLEEFDPNKTLMEKMAMNQKVPYNSETLTETGANFIANISDIIDVYKKNGIPVILTSLAYNLKDQPPFLSDKVDYGELVNLNDVENGLDFINNTQEKVIDSLLVLNPNNALVHYFSAKKSYSLQNYTKAETHFLESHKFDNLRFRAPQEFNLLLKQLSEEKGIYFLDLFLKFSEFSENGIIGNELLLEHVHPNILGYNFMAWNFLNAMFETNVISSRDEKIEIPFDSFRKNSSLYFNTLDSIRGQVTVNALLNNWPFNLYDSIFLPQEIQYQPSFELDLAIDIISGKLSHYNASLLLCDKYLQSGDFTSLLRVSNSLDLEWKNRPRISLYQIFALLNLDKPQVARPIIEKFKSEFGEEFLLTEIDKLLAINGSNRASISIFLEQLNFKLNETI